MSEFVKIMDDFKTRYKVQEEEMIETGRAFQVEDICPWCKMDYLMKRKDILFCPCCDIEIDYDVVNTLD